MDRHDHIRRGGSVKRWHTTPVHSQQTVASHSWGVAALLVDIAGSAISVNLLKAALYHDVAEYDTGDIPAQAKWGDVDLCKALTSMERGIEHELDIQIPLTPEEEDLLKAADLLELMWFCIEEARLGNTNVQSIFARCIPNMARRILTIKPTIQAQRAQDIYDTIKKEFYSCQ